MTKDEVVAGGAKIVELLEISVIVVGAADKEFDGVSGDMIGFFVEQQGHADNSILFDTMHVGHCHTLFEDFLNNSLREVP